MTNRCHSAWWVWWCFASVCCSGALCSVLWARFLQVPALLTTSEMRAHRVPEPRIAVCLTPDHLAHLFAHHLSINSSQTNWLRTVLGRLLRGQPASEVQLLQLEKLLAATSLTLPEALEKYMPPCRELTTKCRWQNVMVPCERLFKKELTQFGLCCIMRVKKLRRDISKQYGFEPPVVNERFDLALQCNNDTIFGGCEFFMKYSSEEFVVPTTLPPGYNYYALLSYVAVHDHNTENLIGESCVSHQNYSRRECRVRCLESFCGCSDPLRVKNYYESSSPPSSPPCTITRMNCLRTLKLNKITCDCLPSCEQVTSSMYFESSPLIGIYNTYDPIYLGLNATLSAVIRIRVKVPGSKHYYRTPTETWLTLLSSLGGVFNMFIGIGLFSVLEFIFLVIVRLPAALRRSCAIRHATVFIK